MTPPSPVEAAPVVSTLNPTRNPDRSGLRLERHETAAARRRFGPDGSKSDQIGVHGSKSEYKNVRTTLRRPSPETKMVRFGTKTKSVLHPQLLTKTLSRTSVPFCSLGVHWHGCALVPGKLRKGTEACGHRKVQAKGIHSRLLNLIKVN